MSMKKTIVVLQSNYIPWKGYFDLLAAADEFIIYDEVQYTRRDWRNRNRIIVNGQPTWLTIPVQSKGNYEAAISEIRVLDKGWASNHYRTLQLNYRRAPYFDEVDRILCDAYERAASLDLLTEINELFLRIIANFIRVQTPILRSTTVPRTTSDPTGRLVEICKARDATDYISGPAARAYLKQEEFKSAKIELNYANYEGYPTYSQSADLFDHHVSIVDALFHCGSEVRSHLKSLTRRASFLEPA